MTQSDSIGGTGWAGLPGSELVIEGLGDLAAGRSTIASTLVEIGAPKLRSLGIAIPPTADSPEHRLYAMLSEQSSDTAHGRYNALVRRLVSFERALACGR